jgi:manganese transport protein
MVALVIFTSRRTIMGEFVSSRPTAAAAITAVIVVLSLNIIMILQSFGLPIPGLPEAG